MLSAQSRTVPSSIASTTLGARPRTVRPYAAAVRLRAMYPQREPARDDVDALVGPATPHFAYQIRARLRELVGGLPETHDVRRYAEAQMARLDRLGHAS